MKPLEGIHVVEAATLLAAPYCAMLLAALGADVVKVEPPGGEPGRSFGDGQTQEAFFAAVNRGKRGIQLDLRVAQDRDRFGDLVSSADVLVDNFLPVFRQACGIGDDWLAQRNPRLVHCTVSGFGSPGPYAAQPATDIVLQALSGLMWVSGNEGDPPVKIGLPIGDMVTGLTSALGVLTALWERDRTDQSVLHVQTSILEGLLAVQAPLISLFSALGHQPARHGTGNPFNAPVQMFLTADDYIVVSAFTDKFWGRLTAALQLPALRDDERYVTNASRLRNREALARKLEECFSQRTTAEWLDILRAADVPCAPVSRYADVLADPHVQQLGILQETTTSAGHVLTTVALPFKIGGARFSADSADLPPLHSI